VNVNAIWAGEEYAFWDYKGNKTFIMNARRGKVIKTEKRTPTYGGTRAKAYVHFEELHPETGEPLERPIQVIRARDVIDEWISYSNEREGIRRERAEAERISREMQERIRKEREERYEQERLTREARERQEQEHTEKLVTTLVNRTGIPKEIISSVGLSLVSLDRVGLEFWLSIPDNRGGMA